MNRFEYQDSMKEAATPTAFTSNLLKAYAMLARSLAGRYREPVITMNYDDWVLSGQPGHIQCKRGAVMIACSLEIEHGHVETYYAATNQKGAEQ